MLAASRLAARPAFRCTGRQISPGALLRQPWCDAARACRSLRPRRGLSSSAPAFPHSTEPGSFGARTPFILIARVQVKPGKVREYLQVAGVVDQGVQDSEPGMLHHTFDVSPDDDHAFTWSEVYQNDAALGAHLANPCVGEYLEAHAAICESFSVEVYGTLSDETAAIAATLPFPVKIWKTMLGYSRIQ